MFKLLPLLFLVVLGILLLLYTLKILPMLVLFIWPTRVRSTFEDGSLHTILTQGGSALAEVIDAFKVLGFSFLGLRLEHTPLWGPTFREISLVSEPDNAYASIVLHPDSSPASKYCYSPFEQGGMVFTRDFAAGKEVEDMRISVKNLPDATPEELVKAHVTRVEAFHARGMNPSVEHSRQARLAATNAFYSTAYAQGSHRAIWRPRIQRLAILWGAFLLLTALTILYPPSP